MKVAKVKTKDKVATMTTTTEVSAPASLPLRDRTLILGVLLAILGMVGADLLTDSAQGIQVWHLAAEGGIALAAMIGVLWLIRGAFTLRRSLEQAREASSQHRAESERWRAEARKYIEGLSHAIDEQLTAWNLTASEKEVAFLLLKGMSSKEIASVRQTSEKTARTQAMVVYSKAGVGGRSELSAFFLEDLLAPAPRPT